MLDAPVRQIAEEAGASAVAVAVRDLETGAAASVDGDRPFHAASTMKVAVLAGLLAAVADGRFRLDDRLHVRNRFRSAADGSPFRVSQDRDANAAVFAKRGRTMPLGTLAEHMIQTSSNLATNLLVDLLGVEAIREAAARWGGAGVEVVRGVEDEAAFEAGILNTATADGLVGLFVGIEEGDGLPDDVRQFGLDVLLGQEFASGIPAGLPDDVRAEARFAHKTGSISTVQHDAGLVYLPDRRPYAVAILTEWDADASGPRREAVAALSRAVYDHVIHG
jgi:beta-lactamase class A